MSISRQMANLIGTAVESTDASITDIISLTQAEYDAIVSPDSTTLYVVTD